MRKVIEFLIELAFMLLGTLATYAVMYFCKCYNGYESAVLLGISMLIYRSYSKG